MNTQQTKPTKRCRSGSGFGFKDVAVGLAILFVSAVVGGAIGAVIGTAINVLVVWRFDRLGRSMPHLITIVEDTRDRGIGFRSLQEGAIDTTTASGELIFNLGRIRAINRRVWNAEGEVEQARTVAGPW